MLEHCEEEQIRPILNEVFERVLDLTAQMFRKTPRNIFDITAIFDTLFYLVNAQVLFLKIKFFFLK